MGEEKIGGHQTWPPTTPQHVEPHRSSYCNVALPGRSRPQLPPPHQPTTTTPLILPILPPAPSPSDRVTGNCVQGSGWADCWLCDFIFWNLNNFFRDSNHRLDSSSLDRWFFFSWRVIGSGSHPTLMIPLVNAMIKSGIFRDFGASTYHGFVVVFPRQQHTY